MTAHVFSDADFPARDPLKPMNKGADEMVVATSTRPPELPAIMLTAADLARELRTSTKTIRRWDQAGKLPLPVRIGSRMLRWKREEIVRWVAAGAPDREEWTRFEKAAIRTARKDGAR